MTTIVENSANQISLKKSWFTILLLRCQWAHQADGLWSVHWVPLDPQQQVLPEQRQDSQRWDQYWWNPLTIRIRAKNGWLMPFFQATADRTQWTLGIWTWILVGVLVPLRRPMGWSRWKEGERGNTNVVLHILSLELQTTSRRRWDGVSNLICSLHHIFIYCLALVVNVFVV